MNNHFEIELMNIDNVFGASEVEKRCFTDPWSTELLQKELDNPLSYYIVINDLDKVVAYAGFWNIIDDAQIMNVAVLPEYRGLGIGNMLMENLIEKAQQNHMKTMSLEVRVSNNTALNLYTKYGFNIEGTRKNYYKDNNEDAHIMWKYL